MSYKTRQEVKSIRQKARLEHLLVITVTAGMGGAGNPSIAMHLRLRESNALWIYIGQTKNLRAQMLGHLYGDNPCIAHYQPSGFAFELVSPQDHRRRFEELIRQLEPLCRGKAFAFSPVQGADLISYVESAKRIRRSV